MEFINLKKQQDQILNSGISLKELIEKNISKVLNHGKFILGPEVEILERDLAEYVGVKHCIACASGTDALLISLMSLGIKENDEVITTPFSFFSTAEVIALLGAKPVFVDIDPQTYNLDPLKLEKAITSKTKTIIPVSLYGQPADFEKINQIATKYAIPVIEDAAQSFGSTHYGKKSCSLSTIAATSFFPSKPFSCYGDGGACFTNDNELANKIRRISKHGQTKRYFHTDIGINGRIDTIQAAILLAKFTTFKQEVISRQKIAEKYNKKLNDIGIKSTPNICSFNTSVYAQYTIQIEERERFQAQLKDKGIPTAVHYPTLLPDQPAIKNFSISETLDHAKQASLKVLSLPMHPYLSEDDQNYIIMSLKEII